MASQSVSATATTPALASVVPAPALPAKAEAPFAIYYIHPLLAGPLQAWPTLLDRVAAAGFSHILLAPPFHGASVLLPDDFERIHPALDWTGDSASALRFLNGACKERGLRWMLDVVLDRVMPDGGIARAHPELFAAPVVRAIDPRVAELAARPRFFEQGEALAVWWEQNIARWQDAGAAGFRLIGLSDAPPHFVRELTSAAHRKRPDCRMIGWTGDLPLSAIGRWSDSGLDATCLSLEGWDWRAEWLWTRAAALTRVAPVIVCAESPFGQRIAAGVPVQSQRAAAARRAIGTAAAMAAGFLVPMGVAELATRRMDPRRSDRLAAGDDGMLALPEVIGADATLATPVPGDGVLGLWRRSGKHGSFTLVNLSLALPATSEAAPGQGSVKLPPGGVRAFAWQAEPPITLVREPAAEAARKAAASGRLAIEAVGPAVDDGRFAAKHTVGEPVEVACDVICEGHDQLCVVLQWRAGDQLAWQETRMAAQPNDLWQARFVPERVGRWLFRIVAWRDEFATFRDELAKKNAAGLDVRLEVMEGRALLQEAQASDPEIAAALQAVDAADQLGDQLGQVTAMLGPALAGAMHRVDLRPLATHSTLYPVDVDRKEAEFASWYEIFPRSMSDDESRHGTFRDVIRHLPRIRDMGFDILYFPPIHPIGRKNRKGRNNSLTPSADDPGSPYAIGSSEGGHDAIHPELGSLEDFQALQVAAAEHGLELALDFAIQCSPDHPWLRQHKDWFAWRPDGSIRYAENPPKKYEDIVNVDFYAPGAVPDLWVALRDAVAFWAEQGVRVFRVDNPHTKPFPFWEWMIGDIRAAYPDALFLAEAFTRPKVMNRLGKVGFTQSYTYFTWRNTRRELEAYSTLLAAGRERDFFRPNFFVNTPDINPLFLQSSGRAGFLIRAALAATLAGSWGVYCGFELCEGTPMPGREEYIDSEKYQLRAWDWERPGNIVPEITRLNQLRRRNPALQTHLGVTFLPSDNDQVIFFEKATANRGNVVLVAVSLDPARPQSAAIEWPLWRWDLPDQASLACEDLLHDTSFTITGKYQRVTLAPDAPYTVWRARPAT